MNAVVIIIVVIVVCLFFALNMPLYITVKVADVNLSFSHYCGMALRKTNTSAVINALITIHKAEIRDITVEEVEAHYLAGGNIEKVIYALLQAKKKHIDLSFKNACAIDLAQKDVFEIINKMDNYSKIDYSVIFKS